LSRRAVLRVAHTTQSPDRSKRHDFRREGAKGVETASEDGTHLAEGAAGAGVLERGHVLGTHRPLTPDSYGNGFVVGLRACRRSPESLKRRTTRC
jgi:hypothetical protein